MKLYVRSESLCESDGKSILPVDRALIGKSGNVRGFLIVLNAKKIL